MKRSRFLLCAQLSAIGLLATSALASGVVASARTDSGSEVVPAISQADHRCFFGTGIQVWQDSSKGGPTAIFCGTHFGHANSSTYWDDLSRNADQLSNFANWNDRISSFEIFNTGDGGTHKIQFCTGTNGGGTCSAVYSGSSYVSYVGNSLNDQISSIIDNGQ